MRYTVEHKEESRERILNVAAKQFRAKGSAAVRVTDVMKAAGLTHGGFYKHFANKDQLLQEGIETALTQVSKELIGLTSGLPRTEALKRVIHFYLSEDHLLHPGLGCALAAMGTEMARMPAAMKRTVSKALDDYAERLDFLMPGEVAEQRRAEFLVLFSSMAGCIMAARAHANKKRQHQILAAGRAFFEQTFCEGSKQASTPALLESLQ